MSLLLFSLLFSIGSLLHYGNQVMDKAGLGSGRFWMPVVIYLLSIWESGGVEITDYYEDFLRYLFVPGLILIQIFLLAGGRENRKKRMAAAGKMTVFLVCCLFLGGCGGVEPEKRMYPLALGIESVEDGFSVTYGMTDLSQATGQEKEEEDSNERVLTLTGADFDEIETLYNRTQEKYLDMGHLQILILGNDLIQEEKWQTALEYLEQEPFVGENVYVFSTEDMEGVMSWQGERSASIGEYIQGLLENRTGGQTDEITLRELYHQKYKTGTLPEIPQIRLENDQVEVVF
jgi:hypothetical protein